MPGSQGCSLDTIAVVGAMPGHDGYGDETSTEEEIQEDCEACESRFPTEEESEDDCEEEIQHCRSGDTYNSLFPSRNAKVVAVENGKEV